MSQNGTFGKDGSLNAASANVSEFVVTKEQDIASPTLCFKLVNGDKISTAVVHLQAATGGDTPVVYAKYEFTPCVISGYSVSGGGDQKPTESVSIRFNIVRWEFTPYDDQSAGTTVRGGWNVGTSAKDASNVSK
jgi:type VI secretion system secreted protein Hcp